MTAKEVLVGYMTYGKHMLALCRQLEGEVEQIRIAARAQKYEQLALLNNKVMALSDQLVEAEKRRCEMARRLGCRGRKYVPQVQAKLKGGIQRSLIQLDKQIEQAMWGCKAEIERQGNVITLQHTAIKEALGKYELRVNV
ncbi:hypothetical protein BIZ37_03495 [Photobacterium sp. BZF1]|uniref:hypothetical protein n=1 Tax=Photobacterium sp. BZF1 TaxID=1904457 RepID=UPI001653D22F|nr:hypothetical protein [Photobacterium sp. BZF1]MBC7001613.1 hypothetical protein [Photobacterium sp. BZF1]